MAIMPAGPIATTMGRVLKAHWDWCREYPIYRGYYVRGVWPPPQDEQVRWVPRPHRPDYWVLERQIQGRWVVAIDGIFTFQDILPTI